MSTLREAAQQALEAMELIEEADTAGATPKMVAVARVMYAPTITALKAALVEDAMQKFTDVNQELEAALAEPVQEPVAWASKRALARIKDFDSTIYANGGFDDAVPLYAALAEPTQDGKCKHCVDGCPACDARKLPVQEPVAWMVYTLDGKSVCVTDNPADFTDEHRVLPLYTAPPQRKPLTEEEMLNIIDDVLEGGSLVDVARAIELAHGIKDA